MRRLDGTTELVVRSTRLLFTSDRMGVGPPRTWGPVSFDEDEEEEEEEGDSGVAEEGEEDPGVEEEGEEETKDEDLNVAAEHGEFLAKL